MRRSVTWATAALVVVAGVTGCSEVSQPEAPAPPSVNPVGNPSDTASPVDTSRPTATLQAAPPPTLAPAPSVPVATNGPAGTVEPGAAGLAACLNGNWSAPVSREFDALGLSDRSKGAVRSGTGLLRLTLGRDQSFTFTYDQVILSLAAGTAVVNGPVTGTWSLAGNTLRTVLISSQTKVSVNLGPVSVPAPASVASALETLPPGEVFVTCTNSSLSMQLPTTEGGGTVTFDRA